MDFPKATNECKSSQCPLYTTREALDKAKEFHIKRFLLHGDEALKVLKHTSKLTCVMLTFPACVSERDKYQSSYQHLGLENILK